MHLYCWTPRGWQYRRVVSHYDQPDIRQAGLTIEQESTCEVGIRWIKSTRTSSFYSMGYPAVASARIEEYNISYSYMRVPITSNYIQYWFRSEYLQSQNCAFKFAVIDQCLGSLESWLIPGIRKEPQTVCHLG